MNFNFNAPINTVSFGFVAYNILQELYKRGVSPNFFPISDQLDMSAYDKAAEDFKFYLTSCANKSRKHYSRDMPCIKVWHINGSENSVSNKTSLLTFYELDSPTEVELNILNNQNKILVSNKETREIFQRFGVQPETIYCPLGFDAQNFYLTGKKYYNPEITVFGVFGKFEKRKHHEQLIKAWLKKFGGDRRYVLHTHVYNPHFQPQINDQLINNLFEGKSKPFNVNVLPFVKTLSEFNDAFNAINVVIDMSGGEGFSLPSFHCLGLGKHGVILNCSAMKDWANKDNAVLVEPSGKEEAIDNVWFRKGDVFNQGNWYKFEDDAFIAGCEAAIEKYRAKNVNEAGKELAKTFTWKKTTDILLKSIE